MAECSSRIEQEHASPVGLRSVTLNLTENICIRISGQLVELRKMTSSNNVWLVTVMSIGSTSIER